MDKAQFQRSSECQIAPSHLPDAYLTLNNSIKSIHNASAHKIIAIVQQNLKKLSQSHTGPSGLRKEQNARIGEPMKSSLQSNSQLQVLDKRKLISKTAFHASNLVNMLKHQSREISRLIQKIQNLQTQPIFGPEVTVSKDKSQQHNTKKRERKAVCKDPNPRLPKKVRNDRQQPKLTIGKTDFSILEQSSIKSGFSGYNSSATTASCFNSNLPSMSNIQIEDITRQCEDLRKIDEKMLGQCKGETQIKYDDRRMEDLDFEYENDNNLFKFELPTKRLKSFNEWDQEDPMMNSYQEQQQSVDRIFTYQQKWQQ